ncbi:MAG TPA: aminomethyl-transferring glycine dehydrogenase, partial [Rhodothermales bacterium]
VYHGPDGIRSIAERVHGHARVLAAGFRALGHSVRHTRFFDTLRVDLSGRSAQDVLDAALRLGINLRKYDDGSVGVALDETVRDADVADVLRAFAADAARVPSVDELRSSLSNNGERVADRTSPYLQHPVFNRYHSETEMMRYLHRLSARDLSLTTSMIPLGSCTMKLNAAAELMPVSMPEFNRIHPYAPADQAKGYATIVRELEEWLGEITGFDAVSLQPNSGASGEYTGLLVIRKFHQSRGDSHRTVCLIPDSAHGTNPASAVMAGMQVVVVKTTEAGDVDLDDLRTRAAEHADRLAALMITYPSTHGVFERDIRTICSIVHEYGGLVYMDGANMNAQVGLCRPAEFGADVCHLNLHKTFAIPHGGGGPGMGPIAVTAALAPFLPGDPIASPTGEAIGPVAGSRYGSASILLISWAYIAMMGGEGLTQASRIAVLNANYVAARLSKYFDVLYRGPGGRVAHEFILDLRPYRVRAGVTEVDVAKRLMDYGFHAPTMSWPVAGTMMIEPTESESKAELDRFCEALISIRGEMEAIERGDADAYQNVLKNAPHTAAFVLSDSWSEPYGREQAAFPTEWTREHKFWPSVRRVDDAFGDRNLVCACPPMAEYATS